MLEACRWMEQQGYEVTYLAPDGGGRHHRGAGAGRRPAGHGAGVLHAGEQRAGNHLSHHEIARGLAAKNPQTLLHTDAVQGFLKVPFSAKTLGADFITISAHKIGGPKGIGALYIGPRVKNPRPLLPGGGQEGGLRSGTEATAQIAGFAKAVELRTDGLEDKLRHMAEIEDYAVEQLSAIPDLVFVGRSDAPHILSVSLVGWPSQNIVNDLGSQGICISAGSACHQGKPSHVVAALQLPKKVCRRCHPPELRPGDHPGGHRRLCGQALRRHHDTRMPML